MRITRITLAAATGALVTLAGACGSGADQPSGGSTPGAGGTKTSTAPAGNGITDLRLNDVFTKAQQALAGAKSVRVTGDVGSGTDAVHLDIKITKSAGAIGTARFRGGVSMGVLRLADNVYLHGTAAEWTRFGAGSGASLLAGKYVKLPSTTPDIKSLLQFTELSGLARLFAPPPGTPNVKADYPTATLRGQQVARIGDPKEGAIYVATTGAPYPLRVETTEGADKGTIDLAEYDKAVVIPHPAVNQIIDLPSS